MLTPSEINEYQKVLEEERAKLLVEIEEGKKKNDFGGDVDHFDEETDEAEEEANELGLEEVIKDRVNAIDEALNKIRMGTYGVCELCKKPIEKEVLDLIPESELCAECKKAE